MRAVSARALSDSILQCETGTEIYPHILSKTTTPEYQNTSGSRNLTQESRLLYYL